MWLSDSSVLLLSWSAFLWTLNLTSGQDLLVGDLHKYNSWYKWETWCLSTGWPASVCMIKWGLNQIWRASALNSSKEKGPRMRSVSGTCLHSPSMPPFGGAPGAAHLGCHCKNWRNLLWKRTPSCSACSAATVTLALIGSSKLNGGMLQY